MYRLARKRSAKNESKRTRTRVFCHSHVCIGLQWLLTADRRDL